MKENFEKLRLRSEEILKTAWNFKWKSEEGDTLRAKALRLLAGFFVLMIILTVLSRAVNTMTTPRVTVTRTTDGTITNTVSADGTVVYNLEQAVYVQAGLKVDTVYIKEGQEVAAGELMFLVNPEDLDKQILEKEQEIKIAELELKAARTGESNSNLQKNTTKNRAAEDYQNTRSKADDEVSKAEADRNEALGRLNRYLAGGNGEDDGDDAALAQLENSLEQARQNLTTVQAQLTELEAEKAAAFVQARENAQTQKGSALTQAEEDAVRAQVDQSYGPKVEAKETERDQAQSKEADASAAVDSYLQTKAAAGSNQSEETESSLREAYNQAQRAYEQALQGRDDALLSAGRAIEDANMPGDINTSIETQEIALEIKKLELEKLTALKQSGGEMKAEWEGIVTGVAVETGMTTPETAAVLIADKVEGSSFVATISKKDEKYVERGSEVSLSIGNSRKEFDKLTVESVKAHESESDMLEVTVQLPAEAAELGTSGTLKVSSQSKKYDMVVPIEALHQGDAENKYYVLIIQEEDGILGSQLKVQKIDVGVAEKNSTYAALTEGNLGYGQEVILSSDKDVEAGDVVRLEEK